MRERIDLVDILRGLALLGVILANFQWMISWDELTNAADAAAVWFLENLISGKFFRLFAFLFGLGFALQMARLESRGVRFVPLYVRRLVILGLIGIAHGTLFWPNDILALFAQFGLLLLLIRRVSNRALIVLAIAALIAPHAYYYASSGFSDFHKTNQEILHSKDNTERARLDEMRKAETHRIRSEGTFAEVVKWNSAYFIRWHTNVQGQIAILAEEFLMFLLGFLAGRRRLFEDTADNTSFLRKTMWPSLFIGVLALAVIPFFRGLEEHPVHGHLAETARLIVSDLQPAAISVFYASAATLLIKRFVLETPLKPLAALGRMALTNYILVSIIVTMLFYDYGLGRYENVSPATGLALAAFVASFMISASVWWMARFRFGPIEWIWRSLTYGERQAMRRGNPG